MQRALAELAMAHRVNAEIAAKRPIDRQILFILLLSEYPRLAEGRGLKAGVPFLGIFQKMRKARRDC